MSVRMLMVRFRAADFGLTRFVKVTSASDRSLNLADLQVFPASKVNVALGKSFTASPVFNNNEYPGANAVDGDLSNIYHSAGNGGFFQVDLGADFKVVTVDTYARALCCQDRMIGAKVELISSSNVVLARAFVTTSALRTTLTFSMASTPICDNTFRNGGWFLVRRLNHGASNWFQANDDLRGFDVYGDYATGINSASQFSVNYQPLVSSTTEFLFMTGSFCCSLACFFHAFSLPFFFSAGDRTRWLITTFLQFNNNNGALDGALRQITASSYSTTPCSWHSLFDKVVGFKFLIPSLDTTQFWNAVDHTFHADFPSIFLYVHCMLCMMMALTVFT
jgi:hypothetical protein